MTPITRTDKAYCRKWTAAHRKGKPTAEITREWLATITGPPAQPKPMAGRAMRDMEALMAQINFQAALLSAT